MAIYGDEKIEQFRERWEGKERLIDDVIKILKGDGKTKDPYKIERRLKEANELLTQNGFPAVEEEVEINCYGVIIKIPALDLIGIDLIRKDCANTVLTGAHLEGADLRWAHLEGAYLRGAHLEGAALHEAHLEGAYLRGAHLEGADLLEAHLEGAILLKAHLEGAGFDSEFIGELKMETFSKNCGLSDDEKNDLIKRQPKTVFANNDFLPKWREHFFDKANFRELFKGLFKFKIISSFKENIKFKKKPDWKNLKKHNCNRWNYTKFLNVDIDQANTAMAKDLYRYVQDQQYLDRFKQRHPWIYRGWKLLADCGGKLSVVGIWAGVIVALFAWLHMTLPWTAPEWVENSRYLQFLFINKPPINLEQMHNWSAELGEFWKYLFVSFDIFSNLGIRSIAPQNPLGVILVLLESVFGFMMLGMLISVLSNRFARRS